MGKLPFLRHPYCGINTGAFSSTGACPIGGFGSVFALNTGGIGKFCICGLTAGGCARKVTLCGFTGFGLITGLASFSFVIWSSYLK